MEPNSRIAVEGGDAQIQAFVKEQTIVSKPNIRDCAGKKFFDGQRLFNLHSLTNLEQSEMNTVLAMSTLSRIIL